MDFDLDSVLDVKRRVMDAVAEAATKWRDAQDAADDAKEHLVKAVKVASNIGVDYETLVRATGLSESTLRKWTTTKPASRSVSKPEPRGTSISEPESQETPTMVG